MPVTVVLADDHAVVRDGLKMLLEAERNITVVGEASNGREAVRLAATLRPNVAIVDVAMPELNGIEAVAKIRELSPATAVIVLSMHSSTEYISRALQAGARGYLVKDSAGAEVVKATRAVCTGRHYLSESISEKVIQDYVRRGLGPIVEDPLTSLTDREREVLQLVVEGKTTAEIADVVSLSPKTIETYRSRILSKLGIRNLPDLVKFAIQHGLTSLER